MDSQQVSQKILQSKKYRALNPETVSRVVKQFSTHKDVEGRSRQLLHQIWGSYYPGFPNFGKLLKRFQVDGDLLPLLAAHSSTKERIPILDQFYTRIFEITGTPMKIIDLGCGLNPLTISWMNLPETSTYQGFDIDQAMVDFNNQVLKSTQYQAKVSLGDLFDGATHSADLAMLLKVLPVIEQQARGTSLEILRQIDAKYLIISFPVASVSGKNKNMVEHYRGWFNKLVEGQGWKVNELLFETELVYVVKK